MFDKIMEEIKLIKKLRKTSPKKNNEDIFYFCWSMVIDKKIIINQVEICDQREKTEGPQIES